MSALSEFRQIMGDTIKKTTYNGLYGGVMGPPGFIIGPAIGLTAGIGGGLGRFLFRHSKHQNAATKIGATVASALAVLPLAAKIQMGGGRFGDVDRAFAQMATGITAAGGGVATTIGVGKNAPTSGGVAALADGARGVLKAAV